ncbi:MAG: hypothetical protein HQL30_06780 [Candidatus Omnitrophica bacterium]|nr:hypothetical protein [Candidatus Omnitrophota bacterium]
MGIADIAVLAAIAAGNWFLKTLPRRGIPLYGADSWIMLCWARKFREKAPKSEFSDHLVHNERHDYPDLFPKMLSFLDDKAALKFNSIIPVFFDLCNLLIVFGISYYVFRETFPAAVSGVVYSLFPPLLTQHACLNSRFPGYLFVNLSIGLLIIGRAEGVLPATIAGIAAGGLVLNTHRFSAQAFFAALAGMSVFEGTWYYALALAGSILAAIAFSGGFYLIVLSGHAKIIRLHYTKFRTTPYEKIRFKGSMLKTVLWGSMLLIGVFGADMAGAHIPGMYVSTVNWAVSLFAAFILTTFIIYLHPFGQGYRYLEYCIMPLSVLFGSAVAIRGPLWPVAAGLFAVYAAVSARKISVHAREIRADYENIVDKDRLRIFEIIKKSGIRNILCVPNALAQSAAYFTGKKVLWTYNAWERYPWMFPKITMPLKFELAEVIKEHDIDAVLLHEKFAARGDLKARTELIAAEGRYLLLRLI